MDWTDQPTNLITPTANPEQRARWSAAWELALKACLGLTSEGQREPLRALIIQDVPDEAPRSWTRSLEQTFKEDFANSPPTTERIQAVADQLHRAIAAVREQAEHDPDFFQSPVGQALLKIFDQAMFHSIDSPALGYTVGPAMNAIVWPTLRVALQNSEALVLPQIAKQRGTVPFEVWANRFRRSVTDVLESWYRPLVSAFYRLSRLPMDGVIPADVGQLGQLFKDAQEHWPATSPLAPLVERRIAIVRNSEAHRHTGIDLGSETFTFINKNRAGFETDRWSASPEEFERLAVHVFHLGEVMRTVLMVMPLRSANPNLLIQVLAVVLKPPAPNP